MFACIHVYTCMHRRVCVCMYIGIGTHCLTWLFFYLFVFLFLVSSGIHVSSHLFVFLSINFLPYIYIHIYNTYESEVEPAQLPNQVICGWSDACAELQVQAAQAEVDFRRSQRPALDS